MPCADDTDYPFLTEGETTEAIMDEETSDNTGNDVNGADQEALLYDRYMICFID